MQNGNNSRPCLIALLPGLNEIKSECVLQELGTEWGLNKKQLLLVMGAQSWDDKYIPSLQSCSRDCYLFPGQSSLLHLEARAKDPSVSGKAHGITEDRVQEAGAEWST